MAWDWLTPTLDAFLASADDQQVHLVDTFFQDLDFPKTHALEDLVLLASVKDPGCKKLFNLASELSPYAVEIRYPESTTPSLQDACASVQSANAIMTYVLEMMKLEG